MCSSDLKADALPAELRSHFPVSAASTLSGVSLATDFVSILCVSQSVNTFFNFFEFYFYLQISYYFILDDRKDLSWNIDE